MTETLVELGAYLRQVREKAEISLYKVEDSTKISIRYLQAMEKGDFTALPGRTYAIGFLRAYSKYLGLDDDTLVEVYKEHFPDKEMALPVQSGPLSTAALAQANRNPLQAWKILLIALLVLAGVVLGALYFIGSQNNPGDLQEKPPVLEAPVLPPENQTDPKENDLTVIEPDIPIFQGLQLEVRAVNGNCWMGVTIDQKSQDYNLQKGQTVTLEADKYLKVRFGNAGAVEVYLNGQLQEPIGKAGQVVTKEYNLDE